MAHISRKNGRGLPIDRIRHALLIVTVTTIVAFANTGASAGLSADARKGDRTRTIESAVAQAKTRAAEFDYAAAIQVLDRASKFYPDSPELLCESGRIFVSAEDPDRAQRYFTRALSADKNSVEAELGIASVEALNHQYSQAQSRLKALLSKDGVDDYFRSRVHESLARVFVQLGDNSAAADEVSLATKLNPNNAAALYVGAFLGAAAKQADRALSFARQAVRLDPYNYGGRILLSQYVKGSAGYQQKVDPAAERLYEAGRKLESSGKYSESREQFDQALTIEPRYYRALISMAAVCLSQGQFKPAAEFASQAVAVDPDGAIANLELGLAYSGMQSCARELIGAPDYKARFMNGPDPLFDRSSTDAVFPQFSRLSRDQQLVIENSVGQLSPLLPRLARAGAEFRFVPYDERITDYLPSRESTSPDARTFDGRYYGSIRGVGGRITLCGIEKLEEAERGGFNAIAHEFAHQVQMVALSEKERSQIRRLYKAAVNEGRTLDYYAAENELEYFAVGWEAYVSEVKRPSEGITSRHTRNELKQRDPGLYAFIVELPSTVNSQE